MPHFRTLTEISYELAHRLPHEYSSGPIFFLAQNEKEARQLQELCTFWKADFPIHAIISPFFQEHHRLSDKDYARRILQLAPHTTIALSTLSETLIELGFERFPRAVSDRSFAIRGDVVDIVDRKPIRLEFEDETIARISLFNPSTQRTGSQVHSVTIWPLEYAASVPTWHEHDLQFEYVTPKYYHRRFKLLQSDVQTFLKIIVASNLPDKVAQLLPQAKIVSHTPGLEGFIIPTEHLLFLTDEHIFGRDEKIEQYKSDLDITNLEPGDYVVHIDHGIALFGAVKTMEGEEYLELQYANNDKLFVPTTQAGRVEEYIGKDNPKLTRLSGAQWESVVHKVEEDVMVTARELLELHAERQTASADSISPELTEEEQRISTDVEFALTVDQVQAITDITMDLTHDTPMDRLLCGDVGFGKTEVALRAAAHVVFHGGQVAFMAPTTVLVQQHYDTLRERLEPYGVTVGVLSRLRSAREQSEVANKLKEGAIDVVVGTHRLLSNDIMPPNLKLVIIDEEQRFGVKHKERFKALRTSAHVLTMTATPIPRTLNLALSGIEDISVLNTAPQHRQAIATVIEEMGDALELAAIQDELERNGQVYLVHNNLQTIYTRLHFLEKAFPASRVAVAHGQMDPQHLIRVMRDFHAGTVDVLVASTIIENGLDITNANTLIVEHAERFGLAQLYQLRGRIGRGATKAYAYLLYRPQHLTPKAKQRLKALHAIKELGGGFELAMKDLEIRGVGDILGKKQHGHVQNVGLNLYTRLLQHAIEQLRSASTQRTNR